MPHRDDFDDDLMDPSSDAYDYKPVSSDEGGKGKAVKLFLAVTVIAGLAGGAWYFVGNTPQSSDDIPVVRADTAPTKEKPSDPGGMSVPNRDKTVYDRVSGENTEPKLERLLPRPEQPLEKPAREHAIPELSESIDPETGMQKVSKELPKLEAPQTIVKMPDPKPAPGPVTLQAPKLPEVPSEEMAEKIAPPPPAPVEDKNAPRALTKREAVAPTQQDKDDLAAKVAEALQEPDKPTEPVATATEVKKEPVKTAARVMPKPPAVKPRPANALKPLAKSGYTLQLLSSKNEAGVKATWQRIKAKNADIIGRLPANIVRADLGPAKGIYYRLRVGPVETGDKAKSLCSQLKKRKVGCFIVRVR
ncbi:SPOR domain-containing protein [Terasakiella sp. SH-1]|uniref:SPOR domain-containing protein n=1 Tax=Terasakiella sp. SH-1 TaxID=2560057 RepID=UPI00107340A7|nr:SPOR domain-containing protein [Terasakiella sp. SH-1]